MALKKTLWESILSVARAGCAATGRKLSMSAVSTALGLMLSLGGCGQAHDEGDDVIVNILPDMNVDGGLDEDGDGFPVGEDCDDSNPNAYPGADPNGECATQWLDLDCDGVQDIFCNPFPDAGLDGDSDGYGFDDCDDSDPNVNPGQPPESCCPGRDAVDQNCDGIIGPDPGTVACNCFYDDDGDGWGEGFGPGPDCDDTDPTIHPDAEEICGDGIDQNCDGEDAVCEEPGA